MRPGATLTCAALLVALVPASRGLVAQAPPAAAGRAPERPALVVLLVVDQFRADYAEMYGRHWTGGLHEILTRGASFTRAAYTFAMTKTCAGHATIGTGTLPAMHGMIDNEWFDPVTRTFTTCTEDPAARPMVYGGKTGRERHSARWLKVPTFADELIRQSGGRARVASVAVKPRSAIMLGGRGGPTTTHVWSEDAIATWSTSSALAERLSPEVEAYVRAHPVRLEEPLAWTRAAPDSVYQFADQAPGEPSGAAGVFPHLFGVPIRTSSSTATLLDAWELTPFPDAFVGGLAAHLTEAQRLGQRGGTDLLAVSFSALDAVGHRYGPRSHEVQDTLYRLDQVIGDLLRVLDARVGRDRYVVAFSSDHGVGLMPEQVFPPPPLAGRGRGPGGGLQEGRASATAIGNAVESLLDERLGRASYVEALFGSYFYFRPGVLDRIRSDPELTRAVEAAARGARGVSRVYWASDLAARTPTDDPILLMMRRSYVPGRSGDLVYVLERNWVTGSDATHGSPYDYDTRVPVVFYGAGVTPGQYTSDASPADIVPTLSVLTGVKMPRMDGQVLREAIGR